jgi:hypothetical protein
MKNHYSVIEVVIMVSSVIVVNSSVSPFVSELSVMAGVVDATAVTLLLVTELSGVPAPVRAVDRSNRTRHNSTSIPECTNGHPRCHATRSGRVTHLQHWFH